MNLNNFGDIAKDMLMCQIISTSFDIFYKKTGLSPQLVFKYGVEGLEMDIGFLPREPTIDEWSLFVDEIFESENFIMKNSLMKDLHNYQSLEEIQIKTVEILKEIA